MMFRCRAFASAFFRRYAMPDVLMSPLPLFDAAVTLTLICRLHHSYCLLPLRMRHFSDVTMLMLLITLTLMLMMLPAPLAAGERRVTTV